MYSCREFSALTIFYLSYRLPIFPLFLSPLLSRAKFKSRCLALDSRKGWKSFPYPSYATREAVSTRLYISGLFVRV